MQNFFNNYFQETINSIKNFNKDDINNLAKSIAKIRLNKGRIFLLALVGAQEMLLMQLMILENYAMLNVIVLQIMHLS